MSIFKRQNVEIAKGLPPEAVDTLSVMMQAARQAGKLVLSHYNDMHDVQEKGHGDLSTPIDRRCNKVINKIIGKKYPGEPIKSEELAPDADISRGRGWIVDPVDATSAMIFRASPDMPSVMIARMEDGVSQESVVHFPLTDEMFYAVRGLGAYKGKQRLHSEGGDLAESWVEMNQYGDSRYESPLFKGLRDRLRRPGGARLVSSSPPHSGIGARIAEGDKRIGAVVHDNNPAKVKQAAWDVIPVALIVEEAGGVVRNFDNQPYDPFKPEPFVMAGSAALASEIINLANMQE